jgi:plasmid stability protein
MVRTVVSIDDDDKKWLDYEAAAHGTTMTAVVREAIAVYRHIKENEQSIDELLNATRGTWKHGDALDYQKKSRKEWG